MFFMWRFYTFRYLRVNYTFRFVKKTFVSSGFSRSIAYYNTRERNALNNTVKTNTRLFSTRILMRQYLPVTGDNSRNTRAFPFLYSMTSEVELYNNRHATILSNFPASVPVDLFRLTTLFFNRFIGIISTMFCL